MEKLGQYLCALINDFTGSSIGSVLVQDLLQERINAAREILLQEIRVGEKDVWEACEIDQFVPILYRYMRAAQEGTAKVNLQLLARVIAGQKYQRELKSDQFLHYANLLSDLTVDEITAIGKMSQIWTTTENISNNIQSRDEPIEYKKTVAMWAALEKELIPLLAESKGELYAIYEAISKTGLLIRTDSLDYPMYRPSKKFTELTKLISFDNLTAAKTR